MNEFYLLAQLPINSKTMPGAYAGAFLFTILLGIINELLITVRMKLYQVSYHAHYYQITLQSTRFTLRATCTTTPMQSYYQTVEIPTEATLVEKVARMTLPFGRGVVTAIYFFNIIVGYLLMLLAMTFDVGLFFAASMGIALGHFIFFRKPVRGF